MLKRILGLALVVLMVVPAFCAIAEDSTWRTPYEETVDIHIALEETSGAHFAEGESYGDNLWTRMFKEKYNVNVIVDWSTLNVGNEYDMKLNLQITSGQIPDAFPCRIVQFNQLKQAGMLEDLTQAYETTASPSMKVMMERNWDIVETAMSDDKAQILAMPRLHYGFETLTSFVWARKDWLDAAGITEVKTIEDYENLMKTFKENNGAEYGLMLDKTLSCFFQFNPAFHAAANRIWVKGADGTIQYGGIQPEVKNQLATFAKWFQEGYINPEFATMEEAKMREDAYNSKVGTYAQQNWAGWQIGKEMVDNAGEGTYWVALEMPSIDDQKTMYPISFPNGIYNVVRKGYEHPEAMIKLIDCYIDVLDDAVNAGDMTIEEVLPFNSNDMHHITGPFKVEFQHYNDIKEVVAASTGGPEKFSTGNAYSFYNEIKKWIDDGDLTSLGRYLQMGYAESSLSRAIAHVDNDQIWKTEMWGDQPQEVIDYGTALHDVLVEGYTKIIMGVEPVDYFDTLVEEWTVAGGDQMTAAVNAMYGAK